MPAPTRAPRALFEKAHLPLPAPLATVSDRSAISDCGSPSPFGQIRRRLGPRGQVHDRSVHQLRLQSCTSAGCMNTLNASDCLFLFAVLTVIVLVHISFDANA